MVVLPEFKALLQKRLRGGSIRGIPGASHNTEKTSGWRFFSPNCMQDLRLFFRKTNIFPIEKKKHVQVLHLVNRHFPMQKILSKSPVGSTSQGTIPGTANVCSTQPGWLGIGLFSNNGVFVVSCEILIYGNTVHCQAILPAVRCGRSFSLHYP